MGYPAPVRSDRPRGTGIVLEGPEDFLRITDAAPAATHFGDFMMGLPGAVENTKAALAAGATAIGNLGQYFTFRLPYWDDDVATTEATLVALGLVAAQAVEVLVHSNLDDGFAGLFADMSSAIGMGPSKSTSSRSSSAPASALLWAPLYRPWPQWRSTAPRPGDDHPRHHDLRQHGELSVHPGRQFREPRELSAG